MSRCKACDVILTDFEMTRKEKINWLTRRNLRPDKYLDLCLKCLTISNEALLEGKNKIENRSYEEVMELLNDQ